MRCLLFTAWHTNRSTKLVRSFSLDKIFIRAIIKKKSLFPAKIVFIRIISIMADEKTNGRICHIWNPKFRGQFFKRTQQSEDRDWLCVSWIYSAIFLPKRQNQITFRTRLKNFNMKNIKMRPPVLLFNLFKTNSMILHWFLKAKSQAKAYMIKIVVCCLRKRKDVKKTVKKNR